VLRYEFEPPLQRAPDFTACLSDGACAVGDGD
jgi:hypothetical protein